MPEKEGDEDEDEIEEENDEVEEEDEENENNDDNKEDYELRERLVNYQVTDGMKLADRVTLLKEHVKKQYFEDINHQLAGLGLGANTNLPDFVPLTAGMQDVIRIQETIQIIKQ
jgi:hypothetical protein